jgi:hypothetical protein
MDDGEQLGRRFSFLDSAATKEEDSLAFHVDSYMMILSKKNHVMKGNLPVFVTWLYICLCD